MLHETTVQQIYCMLFLHFLLYITPRYQLTFHNMRLRSASIIVDFYQTFYGHLKKRKLISVYYALGAIVSDRHVRISLILKSLINILPDQVSTKIKNVTCFKSSSLELQQTMLSHDWKRSIESERCVYGSSLDRI